ncbi:MAG: type II secretion system protein M [Candidatus Obscuribacterales bacterium]|nr:type II secretion system protein M [Steroidobacteraceae bacterium]
MTNLSARFNAMSLRERGLIAAAVLVVLVMIWDGALMRPLDRKKQALSQELATVQKSMATLTAALTGESGGDPLSLGLLQQQALKESVAAADAQLQTVAAGLIPPPRMVQALRDVLAVQSGLRLVSLKNLPARSLAQSLDATQTASGGPYVHPIEMTIEGDYLTLLKYFQSIEALDWRFYWQSLELIKIDYPMNRVRVQLNSLSMDREWLGV